MPALLEVDHLSVRYGGLTVYHRALPFFVGLLLGAMVNAGVWGLVAWIAGPVET